MRLLLMVGILLFATSLIGCSEVGLPKNGTTAAYDKCLKAIVAQNLTEQAAQIACASRTQVSITRGLTGRAGPDNAYNVLSFSGHVENNTADLVVTSFQIGISLPNGKTASKTFDRKFIQPGQADGFTFYADDLKGIKYEDFPRDAEGRSNVSWWITPLTGLTISP